MSYVHVMDVVSPFKISYMLSCFIVGHVSFRSITSVSFSFILGPSVSLIPFPKSNNGRYFHPKLS